MGKPNSSELKKGPWTREEDQKLLAYIEENGHGSWRSLPAKAGLQRCGKSCRLRWTNYLRPDIKRGKFSTHEEKTIIRLHALLGNRWSAIAAHLPKRTDNEIKNYWNTRLKKRLTRMGIDPVTHKPKNIAGGGSAQLKHAANLTHMAQWETARLEAEARLARESKLHSNIQLLQKLNIPPPPLPLPPLQMAAPAPQCLDVLKVWQATSGGSNCFLGSPTTLESPTSTLNFPCSSVPAVPRILSIMANDLTANSNNNSSACGGLGNVAKGNMDHDHHLAAYPLDYGYQMAAAMDLAAINHSSDGYNMEGPGPITSFVELEDTRNYWNELLNMVNSPMELPGF